jgi:hypothetical protein
MTVYIFTGPTLSAADVRAELDAVVLPPVSQGDVYRVALHRPAAIGIVDGYFERVPAVWHKEILWAMAQGIHVFGSASMGALRAAELASFGMEGAGWIFESIRDGVLTDDDEVAVTHGPAEAGYRTASEAMVNIRRTLALAASSGVIAPATRGTLEAIAKALFYPDRAWPLVLQRGVDAGLPADEIAALRAWLPAGRVDQKRADALAMLRLMRERLTAGLPPKTVRYTFSHTGMWERACRLAAGDTDAATPQLDALLDELRLEGTYDRARRDALLRTLAIAESRRQGLAVDRAAMLRAAETFRRGRGLYTPDQATRWLAEQGLTEAEAERLIEDEARLQWVATEAERQLNAGLLDDLRSAGVYGALRARVHDKALTLAARGHDQPTFAAAGVTEAELVQWFFEQRLGQNIPQDISAYVRAAGFVDADHFFGAVLRDYLYRSTTGATAEPLSQTGRAEGVPNNHLKTPAHTGQDSTYYTDLDAVQDQAGRRGQEAAS